MIFIDAGLWIGALSVSDEHHARAGELFAGLKEGGEPIAITESVLAEVGAFFARKESPAKARYACEHILNVRNLEIMAPTREEYSLAAGYVEKYGLSSYADALSMAAMESRGIKKILSFDADFDRNKRVKRIH